MEEDKEDIMPVWVVEDPFPERDIQKKEDAPLPGLNKSPGVRKKVIRKII